MKKKIRLGCLFKKIHLGFEANCNKNLQKYNITHAQMDVLIYLSINKNSITTQRDLEMALSLKNPTITGILNRLEEKGLIIRKSNPNDKRSKIIELTEKANCMMEDMHSNLKQLECDLVEGLSSEDRDNLIRLLNVVLNNLTDR